MFLKSMKSSLESDFISPKETDSLKIIKSSNYNNAFPKFTVNKLYFCKLCERISFSNESLFIAHLRSEHCR